MENVLASCQVSIDHCLNLKHDEACRYADGLRNKGVESRVESVIFAFLTTDTMMENCDSESCSCKCVSSTSGLMVKSFVPKYKVSGGSMCGW